MARVLIIDDDPRICLFFSSLLEDMGHGFETAHTVKEGARLFWAEPFDLVLLDLELPDGNGLSLMPQFKDGANTPEVIIITGTGDARGAELAFKYGAWDYVQKPFLLDEVSLPITRALQYRQEKKAQARPVPLKREQIVGESVAIRKSLEDVAKAATTDLSVLITGETGTGKELFARAIHNNSRRADNPFVAVDCGALPDTLVESTLFGHEKGAFTGAGNRQEGLLLQAQGGTLMLDEVGDLPLDAQKSLLRTLQERQVRPIGSSREMPVDIRLVAATHLDLDDLASQGRFRQDLLFRIRAMEIILPPLRERGTDVQEIALRKVHDLSRRYNLGPKAVSEEFLAALCSHQWPGNVRELVNVLEYVLASSGADSTLYPKHLPPAFRVSGLGLSQAGGAPPLRDLGLGDEMPTLKAFRNQMEKRYLKALLNKAAGDRSQACRISGISQSRLYGLLTKHRLSGFNPS